MQEVTYVEPEKVQASGITEAEMKHILDVSNKHMMTMVCILVSGSHAINADVGVWRSPQRPSSATQYS